MHRMYTVSKAPMKFVAKSRRGLTNNIDRLDTLRDNKLKMEQNNNEQIIELPKPVFQTVRKHHTSSNNSNHHNLKRWRQQEEVSPEHEELIRFISESWSSVCNGSSSSIDSVEYYEDSTSRTQLDDFVPFDLEAWWGKRIFNNITKSIP